MNSYANRSAVFAVVAVLLSPQQALADCAAGYTAQMTTPLSEKPDQALFSRAVLLAGNAARCGEGLADLRHDTRLRKAAFVHSRNMARTRVFDHRSRVNGARTLQDRAKLAGVRGRRIAENLALIPRFRFGDRQPFVVEDRALCRFLAPKTGKRITPHSYASLAEKVVEAWLASPGHRRNLLSKRLGRVGAALVLAEDDTCGQFYVTQVFAD